MRYRLIHGDALAVLKALVALRYGRNFLGIELHPEYVAMAERRIAPELAQPQLLEVNE